MISNEELTRYETIVQDLHERWSPHPGQLEIGRTLFNNDIRDIFVQCGRKWGKTEIVLYILWRWALSYPNAACYYISPYAKQSKEIIWASKRIQNFGPSEYISSTNNTELRLNFNNDSFIKCDGSDNFDAYRGITPHIVAYDEFKDFRPEFHIAMAPNLMVHKAPCIIIGTPPEKDCQYTEMAEEYKKDPDKAHFIKQSWDNPFNDKKWLAKEKQTLFDRGEEDVWYREYEAKFVRGGKSSIFPMLDPKVMRPHNQVISEIKKDMNKLKWYQIADPGSSTCFAVLFAAINPYTKKIYFLDEIYETNQKKTSSRLIGNRIIELERELYPRGKVHAWYRGRDEAATWFEVEMMENFGMDYYFAPVSKAANTKEAGLSLIKDALLLDRVVMSDRCKMLYWEMENYVKDKNGKIPKENDHLIDDFRYLLSADGYTLQQVAAPLPESQREDFRGRTIEQDMDEGFFDEDNPEGFRLDIPY